MIGSMLVGLDGSTYSQKAVELGSKWARGTGALLAGIAIVDEPSIRQGEFVPLGGGSFKEHRDEVRLEQVQRQIEGMLEKFERTCDQAQIKSKTIRGWGEPADEILEEVQEFDMVLLGLQTRFHFATDSKPCDTLARVVKSSPRPVVAIPDHLPDGNVVMIAMDGSAQAAKTLQIFQAVGLPSIHDVHIVTVDEDHDLAERRAKVAAAFLGHHKIQAETHAIGSELFAAEVLLQEAKRLRASLIVMGSYGRSTLTEFFFGSVTKSMMEQAEVPLFLYH